MASADLPPASAVGRRIYAERVAGAGPPLPEALLAVAAVLQRALGVGPMTRAGEPARQIAPTPQAVGAWLDEVRQRRRRGEPALFTLAADPSPASAATLTYEVDPSPENALEWVWYPVPTTGAPPVDVLLDVVAAIRRAFGAHRAAVEDDLLMVLYRGRRAAERARQAVPPHLRQYVPDAPVLPGSPALPDLLVPQEYDRRRVPDAVWWVNGWDAVQVETVGRTRVLRAPWFRIIEQPDGGLALASSELPPDARNPDHRARLARLVEALDLRALQEAHRLNT